MWSVNVRHAFVPMRGMEHSCRCKLRGSFNSKTSAKHAEKHQAKKPPEVGTPGIFHARGHGASGQQEYSLRAANGQADAGNIPRARPTDKQTPGIFRARGQRASGFTLGESCLAGPPTRAKPVRDTTQSTSGLRVMGL
eukprot:2750400-Pyramimonas_sp.AAC.2